MEKKSIVFAALLCTALAAATLPPHALALDTISNEQLMSRIKESSAPLILDVRTPGEFARGRVPGAINIPHTDLASRLDELTQHKGREVAVYCEAGVRAAVAEDILGKAGFEKVMHLEGDMRGWRAKRLPQER